LDNAQLLEDKVYKLKDEEMKDVSVQTDVSPLDLTTK